MAAFEALLDVLKAKLFNPIVLLLFGLAVVYFLWGVFSFVQADDDHAREEGRNHMVWGVIGIAIMISVWGIMYLISDTFGIEGLPLP